MPGPTHPSVVNNTELLSKGVIEALTYTFKYNAGNSNLPMTDGSGGWNIAFLYKTFETARNKEVLVDFVRTRFSPVSQSGNVGDIYAIQVRDNITGNHLFGFSGTEVNAGVGPIVSTIGSDVQLAIGVTWLPGSPYQTIYNGMSSWLGQRLSLLPAGTSPQIVGQSLGGYIARDMAQAFGLPMSDVTLFQAPGEFGVFGQIATLATFGIFNDGNFNYVRSPDIVPSAGLGSRYIYLGGELSTDGLGGALIGAHGMNKVNDELVDLARRSMALMGLSGFDEHTGSGWLNSYTTFSISGVGVALMSSGLQTYLVSLDGGNVNGFATVSLRDFRSGNLGTPMAQAARDQANGMNARVLPASNLGAQLGSALGSSVGVMLGGSNPLAQIGAGTLLGAIGSAFGQWLDHDLAGVQMRIGDGLAQSFGQQLQASFQSTGIQVVSSQLTNIAMQAIGVTGFGGQLAGVVVNTAITHGVQLALSRLPGLSGAAPSNFMGAAKGNVAAFFGAKLGSLVVSAQTQAGSILGSLGSTLGQIAARQIFVSMGWMAGPVGAFIGTVLGTLIGNLFGRKKPKIPTANAEVYLNYTTDKFEAGPSVAANGGNLSLVKSMASSAEMTLNGFVQALAGDMPFSTSSWSAGLWRNGKLVDVNGGLQTFYGHTGGQLWVKLGAQNAAQQNVITADDAVSRGVLWSLSGLNVIGGDIFAKRALANSSKENISILLADLQVAEDYAKYRKDYHTINSVIGQNPNSALTAGWIQTFQRAGELKLNDWSTSDFNGGLQGFLTSMGLESYGAYMENVRVTDLLGGMTLSVKSAGALQNGVFSMLPQALDKPLGNDLLNPHGSQGLAGWQRSDYLTTTAQNGVNLSADWSGSGNDVFWSFMQGTPPNGAITDVRSEFVESRAGATYEYSVKAAQHRGVAQLFIEFYDANKNQISYAFASGTAQTSGGYHGDLANFGQLVGQAVAPPGTAYRKIGLRLYAVGEVDPYAFFTQPVTREVSGAAVDWEADGNAIRIDDLAKIGYVKLTEGNTAGRDFLDFSQRTAAVGWSDWSQTTEYETHYDQYGYEWQEPVTVTVTGGDDVVVGSRYGDHLAGAAGWDWIDGGEGDDTIEGGDGNDVLLGRQGRDRLIGGAGDDYLWGGADDDNPWDGNPNSGMWGGTGDDTLVLVGGRDAAFGEDGDDVFLMEQDGYTSGLEASGSYDWSKMDYVDAGAGSDTVSYERFTTPITAPLDANFWPHAGNSTYMPVGGINGVRVALSNHPTSWTNGDAYWADVKYIMGDWIKGVENVTGSRFNDYLWGDAADNILKGGDGDDFLDGHLGNDTLEGGAGADYLLGIGGGDTASYESSNAGVFIDMATGEAFGGHATGDRFSGMQHLTGSRFADELKGDAGSNRIKGLDGDDWIVATVGSDVYEGGDGLDTVDYSTGFASGNASYQVWVEDGYWEYDQWLQQDVWISTGEGHYETQTGHRAGLQVNGGIAEWRAVDGTAGTHSLIGVEHIIGTSGADFIAMGGSDDYIAGGKGNDSLAGGSGGDTYYFNLGDGVDTITETNVGTNVISFGAGIGFNQLTFTVVAGPSGHMTINYSATDSVRINGNLPDVKDGKLASADDNRIKTIDMNGSGQLDVSQFEIYRAGTAAANTISGIRTLGDFIAGFGGNDTIYGMQSGQWEDHGNIIIGGAGNDTIYTSGGDDQFAFERGSGRDTINDAGGEDVLVFGPNVAADDVIYKVVGNDLYIGIAEAASPNLEAHQVTDYVRVVNGGVKWEDAYGGGASFNTVEFINAGGTWIDLRKLDLNWTVQYNYNGGVMPIVFDLGGDGLEITGVESSNVVSRLSSGQYARTSWVGPTNGILAFDRNGDGEINTLAEISFVQDREGAKTDLEGLQAWDTNNDGKLNALDEGWSNLKMWVDRNQNGRSTEQELRTLEEVGIIEIDLKGVATGNTAATTRDSFVHNTLSFTWASGEKGAAYDVQLARRLLNELGLSAEEVRAAWGDGSAEGELGRLVSNPVVAAAAKAVLVDEQSSLMDRAGAAFSRQSMALLEEEVEIRQKFSAEAVPELSSSLTPGVSVDFSDHDAIFEEDEVRWADVLGGKIANGGAVNETDAHVRATLEALKGAAERGSFGHAFSRPEIDDDAPVAVDGMGLDDASVGIAPLSLTDAQIGRPDRLLEADLGLSENGNAQMPEIDQAASLLSAVTDESDVWAPAEFSRASGGAGRQWWRSEVLSPDDLSVTAPIGTFDLSSAIEANAQGAVASQHQQLVQALAAFGPKAGGGASAIWKRSGEIEDGHLAGASSEAGRWRFAGASRIHA